MFKLPLVTIIENNQWAISVPRSKQSAAQTLAQKGIAAGIDVVQVDGNDVIAVYKAVKDAIEIRKGRPHAHRMRDLQDEHAHNGRRPDEIQERGGG